MRQITLQPSINKEIRAYQKLMESGYSESAFRNEDAARLFPDKRAGDVRPAFFHDTDRIVHSRAYTRYIDKTQVFYLIRNDHITHRVLHVQLVSKIARTIGRFLRLNEDLIEAISLGHDVGHTPFGHKGETLLSSFCQENGGGYFEHNVQSMRLFHELENSGCGNNLTVQVLDGIICHNGEMLQKEYKCNKTKTADILLDEYHRSMAEKGVSAKMVPMTLEGCVMRISDVIAYVGRDIEDAIILGMIKRKDLPEYFTAILGNNNRDIVNNLIIDLVNNSYGMGYLSFSEDVFDALNSMKDWNYEHIYGPQNNTEQTVKISNMFQTVTQLCLDDLVHGTDITRIRSEYLSGLPLEYQQAYAPARIVSDFVSGMTDEYMLALFDELVMPHSVRK